MDMHAPVPGHPFDEPDGVVLLVIGLPRYPHDDIYNRIEAMRATALDRTYGVGHCVAPAERSQYPVTS